MSKEITREDAWSLLTEYNKDRFHLKHALTVEGVMKYFAKELGYGNEEDFWGIVGLLHDLDFEQFPEEHCIKEQEIMKEHDIDERIIHATTALGTIHPQGRELGLKAGANVVMPNLSPVKVRKLYDLYENKICTGEEAAQCRGCLERRVKSAGYNIVTSIGNVKKEG